ncbi:sugar-binding protein [Sphingobacterium paludis]|uniref:Carbohydrate binding protein with CBM9 domain n=1 Tax=Sphingobacterium paludis TaxID=1476465 RepID=A0A4V3E1Q4_9SPHI|nr:sugar-binding protein [Sphingobacterium paludis]TDS13888.1 carbohydrate binding protein with CBM9 domain [Sphingobacterium paludis]
MKTRLITFCATAGLLALCCCGKGNMKTLALKETDQQIIIDADMDPYWENCDWEPLPNRRFPLTGVMDPKDLEASFKGLWDSEYLYFLVKIRDDKPFVMYATTAVEKMYDLRIKELDGIEFYFNNGLKDKKENTLNYFRLTYGADTISLSGQERTATGPFSAIKSSYKKYEDGYLYECSIPWGLLGIHPSKDESIRFELNVIDNDGDPMMPGAISRRKSIITWADETKTNPAWDNSIYGTIQFDKGD